MYLSAYKITMHYARMSGARRHRVSLGVERGQPTNDQGLVEPIRCLFQTHPTALPVIEVGAERHCCPKTKEICFGFHKCVRSSHSSLQRQAQSSCFAAKLSEKP